jgi:glutaredoxin-dependent peroxiredoxin
VAARISPFALSQDSPWSHESWAEAMGVKGVIPILSDWEKEATRAFGVEDRRDGMRIAARSAFLVDAGTVRAAWMLGPELPDVDAVIASASSSRA